MDARTIAWYLAKRNSSPFYVRKMLAVVPNVSWGLLPWEADLVALSKSGYLTEIEIKISLSDWKADFKKSKHKWVPIFSNSYPEIKKFYYAAPLELAKRHVELELPFGAGVIGIEEEMGGGRIHILKEALVKPNHKKLTETQVLQLLRLAAIKAWNRAYQI